MSAARRRAGLDQIVSSSMKLDGSLNSDIALLGLNVCYAVAKSGTYIYDPSIPARDRAPCSVLLKDASKRVMAAAQVFQL